MTIHNITASLLNKPAPPSALAKRRQARPCQFTETELEQVAAAGGKKGIAPGNNNDPPQRPK